VKLDLAANRGWSVSLQLREFVSIPTRAFSRGGEAQQWLEITDKKRLTWAFLQNSVMESKVRSADCTRPAVVSRSNFAGP